MTLDGGDPVSALIGTDPLNPSLNAATMFVSGQLNFLNILWTKTVFCAKLSAVFKALYARKNFYSWR